MLVRLPFVRTMLQARLPFSALSSARWRPRTFYVLSASLLLGFSPITNRLINVPDTAFAEPDLTHQALTDFLYQLGVEYRQAGRLEEARNEFEKVLALDPDDEKAKAALVQVARKLQLRRRMVEETVNRVLPQQKEKSTLAATSPRAPMPPTLPQGPVSASPRQVARRLIIASSRRSLTMFAICDPRGPSCGLVASSIATLRTTSL